MGESNWQTVTRKKLSSRSAVGIHRSKEDDVNRISTSIFVTNFPQSFTAKDLFYVCKQYGHVVDFYIPDKKTKAGKMFGFVRFINIFNVERLVSNLCTIWVDRFKLHANTARYQRPPLNKNGPQEVKTIDPSRNSRQIPQKVKNNVVSDNSYVNMVKSYSSLERGEDNSSPAIVMDNDCLNSKDISKDLMGRVKELESLTNLKSALSNKGFADLSIRYLGELWVLLEFSSAESMELFQKNEDVGSWFSELNHASIDFIPEGRIVWVEVEGVPFKLWSGNTFKRLAAKWGDLLDVDQDVSSFHSKRLCLFTKNYMNIHETFKILFRGKVFWIRAKEVPGWVPELLEDSDDDDSDDEDHMDDGFMEGDINEQNSDCNGDSSTVEVVPETSLDESVDSKKQKSDDPFNIYPLLNKDGIIMNDMTNGEKSSLKFPPGFTPDQVDVGSIVLKIILRKDPRQTLHASVDSRIQKPHVPVDHF
ncbi:nucleotide-binding alpha-beta plait domain-containing protein [Tanacetum coccineum]